VALEWRQILPLRGSAQVWDSDNHNHALVGVVAIRVQALEFLGRGLATHLETTPETHT